MTWTSAAMTAQAPPPVQAPGPDALELDVERARGGDLRAFETLYRSTVGRVHAVCLRLCGQRALAEELTQEVFIRAWRKLPGFRGESAFATWLYRIAVNLALEGRRGRGRWLALEEPIDDATEVVVGARHAAPDLGLDLERAILGLPEGARRVFVLHDVEGYAHEEVAALTGIAVGTSKAQLHRARRLLREVLGR